MLTISTWEECDGLEGTLCKFILWHCVAVLKELIFNNFYLGRVHDGLEGTGLSTIYTLGVCGGLERTDF